jgi:hypothetical protein
VGKKCNIVGGSQSLPLFPLIEVSWRQDKLQEMTRYTGIWFAVIRQQSRHMLLYFIRYGCIVTENLMMIMNK